MTKKIEMSVTPFEKMKKVVYQKMRYSKGYSKCLLIVGCQRSGTTLISNVFNKIDYCRVFGEFSSLSNQDLERIRLNPFSDILKTFNYTHSPLIVCKPLVESQHTLNLLANIPNSRALWVFRHFKDVALSDVQKFKNNAGRGNLYPIIENKSNNWRNEEVTASTRHLIKELYSDRLSALECACLFWYSRNILYFDQVLQDQKDVYIWEYDDFVTTPLIYLNELLTSMKLPPQSIKTVSNVYRSSMNSARNAKINKDIHNLCEELYLRLKLSKQSANSRNTVP